MMYVRIVAHTCTRPRKYAYLLPCAVYFLSKFFVQKDDTRKNTNIGFHEPRRIPYRIYHMVYSSAVDIPLPTRHAFQARSPCRILIGLMERAFAYKRERCVTRQCPLQAEYRRLLATFGVSRSSTFPAID